jgi:hypothetical protein
MSDWNAECHSTALQSGELITIPPQPGSNGAKLAPIVAINVRCLDLESTALIRCFGPKHGITLTRQ